MVFVLTIIRTRYFSVQFNGYSVYETAEEQVYRIKNLLDISTYRLVKVDEETSIIPII